MIRLIIVDDHKLIRMMLVITFQSGEYPDISVVGEAGGGEALFAVLAATPADIRDKIQRDVVKVMSMPEVRKRLEADGGEPVTGTSAEFAAMIRDEIATWARVFKATGITPE
jgi:tripartite-type tricarboxylate transporter receptor subunit TctC